MQQKVYETCAVMFLSTWDASLGPDKDESVIWQDPRVTNIDVTL